MSQTTVIIIGIILFALATMLLYMIGLKRKMTEEKRLNDMLLNNSARRVLAYLKDHDQVTKNEIGYIIKDVRASEFHSRKTAVISDGRLFQDELVRFMLDGGYISEVKRNGRKVYILPEKNSNSKGMKDNGKHGKKGV